MFGLYYGKFYVPYLLDEFIGLERMVAFGKIRTDPLSDVFCFANIEKILLGTIVFIDTGGIR
jgi:hypothetical protein